MSKLNQLHIKAEFAVGAVNAARKQVNHPGPLWYHAIGLFNAFYAINEELKNRTKNAGDDDLRLSVEHWWEENKATVDGFFGSARNTATHQGDIYVEPVLEWEWDIPNDTQHPIAKASVTVGSSKIQGMPGANFLDLCQEALTFMLNGVLTIDADYRSRGGTKNAIVDDRYKDLF